jgi:hypothetical protein
VVAGHPEQGWSLLCNGIVLFDDAGTLRLDAQVWHARCRKLPEMVFSAR